MVRWTWWDWSLSLGPLLPSVLWHCWLGHLTRKTVHEMTYNVFSGTLNPTHSLTHFTCIVIYLRRCWRACGRIIGSDMVWRTRNRRTTFWRASSSCWTTTTSWWKWTDFPEKTRSLGLSRPTVFTVRLNLPVVLASMCLQWWDVGLFWLFGIELIFEWTNGWFIYR